MFKSKWQKKYEDAMSQLDSLVDHHKELAKRCRQEGEYPDAYRHTITQQAFMDALDILKETAEL